MNILTIVITALAAAAPAVTPLLNHAPAWAQSLMSGLIAGVGAVYHLYQDVPK